MKTTLKKIILEKERVCVSVRAHVLTSKLLNIFQNIFNTILVIRALNLFSGERGTGVVFYCLCFPLLVTVLLLSLQDGYQVVYVSGRRACVYLRACVYALWDSMCVSSQDIMKLVKRSLGCGMEPDINGSNKKLF